MKDLKIHFLGGAGTVTGSKFLVETRQNRILIDCGLFQGVKDLRLRNWLPLPIDAGTIDAVILTHAHLDHTGYIPLLIKQGFAGPIFCTAPTRDITEIILKDFSKIQEEDADFANEHRITKHKPAKPLYSTDEAKIAIERLSATEPYTWIKLDEGVRFRLSPSGHILGSVFIELEVLGKRIVFSGDLGRTKPLILHPPEAVRRADILVLESTYGDRLHIKQSPLKLLADAVNETVRRKGTLIVPSFAVGRTQDLLHLLAELKRSKKIGNVPVYLDSPMAISATEIFLKHRSWHKLNERQIERLENVATMVRSQKQSLNVMKMSESSVVIAGSGMVAGGRVLAHLEKRLPDRRNAVAFVGFQAPGTRGAQMLTGCSEIRMRGEFVPMGARIVDLSALSAHADQSETIEWLRKFDKPPQITFIVHGEPQASDSLRVKLRETLGWECVVPKAEQVFTLS